MPQDWQITVDSWRLRCLAFRAFLRLCLLTGNLRVMEQEQEQDDLRPLSWDDLPQSVRDTIEEGRRKGTSYSFKISERPDSPLIEISWRPGDPNALADAIIRKCDRPLTLVLDGHRFIVMPEDIGWVPDTVRQNLTPWHLSELDPWEREAVIERYCRKREA